MGSDAKKCRSCGDSLFANNFRLCANCERKEILKETECCYTCLHNTHESDDMLAAKGDCRRYPTILEVPANHFCGEFTRAPAEGALPPRKPLQTYRAQFQYISRQRK